MDFSFALEVKPMNKKVFKNNKSIITVKANVYY